MNYYISDIHYNHSNIIRFDRRPFNTIEEMNQKIIENWNNKVKNNDTVYILGDFIWSKGQEWNNIVKQFNGNKVLIKGNHDPKEYDRATKSLFSDIKDYKEIIDNNRYVIMSHYPILCYKRDCDNNYYMLHGHTHITREQELIEKWTKEIRREFGPPGSNCGNIYNVGCMMPYMKYTPQSLDEIIKGADRYYGRV